jgi:hypothetical protein
MTKIQIISDITKNKIVKISPPPLNTQFNLDLDTVKRQDFNPTKRYTNKKEKFGIKIK